MAMTDDTADSGLSSVGPVGEQLLDLAYPYALDAVSETERGAIDAQLRHADPALREEFADIVAGVRETMAHVSIATAAPPPAHLRGRVLDALPGAGTSRPATTGLGATASPWWRRRSAVALVSAAALIVGAIGVTVTSPAGHDRPTTQQVLDTAADRGTVRVGVTGGGNVTVQYSRRHQLAIVRLDGVAPPASGRVYQLWVIADAPLSAGTVTDAELTTPRVVTGIGAAVAVAVSLEPAGGSPAPTAAPVAVAELPPR